MFVAVIIIIIVIVAFCIIYARFALKRICSTLRVTSIVDFFAESRENLRVICDVNTHKLIEIFEK